MKKGKLVDLAFKLGGITTRTKSATPEETEDALYFLEGMMTQWDGLGMRLGYVMEDKPQSDTESGIPAWANSGVYNALSARLCGYFEKQCPPTVMKDAALGVSVILGKTVENKQVPYPSRFPKGSGNNTVYSNKYYYPVDRIITDPDFLSDDGGEAITT
jgi:hypothetical protein